KDIAFDVPQAIPLHVLDDGQSQQRRILALVPAGRTDRRRRTVTRSRKQLRSNALVGSAILDEQEPYDRLAGFRIDLLPQAGHRWLRRRRSGGSQGLNSGAKRHESRYNQPCQFPCQLALSVRLRPPESTN